MSGSDRELIETVALVDPRAVRIGDRAAITRLRGLGWSDRSIARHLDRDLLSVRDALGLPTYNRDGVPVGMVRQDGLSRPRCRHLLISEAAE